MVDRPAPRGRPGWGPPTVAPAAWYPDPSGQPMLRYFDGRVWTDHTVALAVPAPPHRRLPIVVAFGAIGVLLVSLFASRFLIEHLVQYEWPIVVYVAISVTLGYGPSVWWCWYSTGRWGTGDRRTDLGLRARWADLGWGPVIWLASLFAQGTVAAVVNGLGVPLTSNTEGISDLRLDRTYVIAILVTAVVAAPIVEELVFRGIILAGLMSRMGWVWAVIVQGGVFGVAHVDPARGVGNVGLALILSAAGVILGGAAYLLRRIAPTMLAHAILNAVVLVVVLTR